MKRILCYGDSNTWGTDPSSCERFDENTRWTGVLQNLLGSAYKVIEEGCSGRTTVWEDPIELDKNGYAYLKPCLESQRPLDLIIIMLGTNDLKPRFSVGAADIASSAGQLVKTAKSYFYTKGLHIPEVLLVSPILVAENIEETPFNEMFGGQSAVTRSKNFSRAYKEVAKTLQCNFLDAAQYADPSPIDAIHMEAETHKKLGYAIAQKVVEIIGK
ncbi:SGNH/GDSL hydrolase family protein [Cellulosilyticum sp. I15G10I2]|uniref:SGNH/GDSL hydrolase family protein n=1 Tax=Cellulosilyticum sp. I15G10I2 TaxID=1892843 RepID=UPI00085BE8A1|nr:SGNH/GDSL hydrolase family protein [Cellulosilyticum sp. I15G10I2]